MKTLAVKKKARASKSGSVGESIIQGLRMRLSLGLKGRMPMFG